jgi:hypothetical protein
VTESLQQKKDRRAIEGEQAWRDHQAKQKATDENMLRLRALRLAREAEAAAPKNKRKA